MENMQKVVTAKDVAKAAGCSLYSVRYAFGKSENLKRHISAELEARILQVGRALGYDPALAYGQRGKFSGESRWGIGPSMQTVAKKVGCSVTTVSNAFAGGIISPKTKESILKAAEEIGYVYRPRTKDPEERKARRAAKAKAESERNFSLRYAGFKNREEQNAYMEVMRSMGHSNAQISRKVGLTIQTVRRRIGTQPEDMSRDNRVAGMKHYAAENQRRRIYVDTHLVRTYNNMILECGQLRSQAAELVSKADELTKEITKMKPQVEKAKLSTEKPAEMPVEQLLTPASPTSNTVLQ